VVSGIPAERIASAPTLSDPAKTPMPPVIYRIDMKTAAGIFYANSFQLRDKDLVFVPAAQTVDWGKYLDLFRTTVAPAVSGATSAVILDRGF
jgi:hypothetical protein